MNTLITDYGNQVGSLEEIAEKYVVEQWTLDEQVGLEEQLIARLGFIEGARHMEAELLRERERSRGLGGTLNEIAALLPIPLTATRIGEIVSRGLAAYRASAKEGEEE